MVQQFKTRHTFLDWRSKIPGDLSVGFVPTMGNLHAGHLSLVEQALQEHPVVVVSIFVNPKQFGPSEDFGRYPRTLEQDIGLLSTLFQKFRNKRLIVFCPQDPMDIYPKSFQTTVQVTELTNSLCGKSRPTHFSGVTTVVSVLLGLVSPKVLYLGQKDYQQYLVIKRMVQDLYLPYQVIACPIVRDSDGLALSSRNQYLSASERKTALHLPTVLKELAQLFQYEGLHAVENKINSILKNSIADAQWDYLEILDASTLKSGNLLSQNYLLAGALQVGKTRLIDNLILAGGN